MKRLVPLLLLLLLFVAPTAKAADDAPHEHTFSEWYTVTAATCTALGEERRDCGTCDTSETREIPMTAHAFGEWETVTEPDCLHRGAARRVCETCEAEETKELSALDHSFVQDPAVAPTCTTAGRTEGAHCERCGAVLWPGPTTLKPLGHFLDENGDCKICGAHIKDFCPYCGKDHDGQLFGGFVAWFHGILLRLRELLPVLQPARFHPPERRPLFLRSRQFRQYPVRGLREFRFRSVSP